MVPFLRLLFVFSLPVIIVVFIMFIIGAKKVQKNRLLWGVLGVFAYLIPVVILGPITFQMLFNSIRQGGGSPALVISYAAITTAVGVLASVMVYKLILVKAPTVANNRFVFCSECGTQCPDNTVFCNKCGNKLSEG